MTRVTRNFLAQRGGLRIVLFGTSALLFFQIQEGINIVGVVVFVLSGFSGLVQDRQELGLDPFPPPATKRLEKQSRLLFWPFSTRAARL